jgi:hypothetical protein
VSSSGSSDRFYIRPRVVRVKAIGVATQALAAVERSSHGHADKRRAARAGDLHRCLLRLMIGLLGLLRAALKYSSQPSRARIGQLSSLRDSAITLLAPARLRAEVLFRRLSSGDHEFDDDASIQGLMVCVYGRNLDLVRSRRKTSDDDGSAAGFGPDPRRAINRDVEMPDAGRHIERLRTEHRDDLQIFSAVLDEHDSAA